MQLESPVVPGTFSIEVPQPVQEYFQKRRVVYAPPTERLAEADEDRLAGILHYETKLSAVTASPYMGPDALGVAVGTYNPLKNLESDPVGIDLLRVIFDAAAATRYLVTEIYVGQQGPAVYVKPALIHHCELIHGRLGECEIEPVLIHLVWQGTDQMVKKKGDQIPGLDHFVAALTQKGKPVATIDMHSRYELS